MGEWSQPISDRLNKTVTSAEETAGKASFEHLLSGRKISLEYLQVYSDETAGRFETVEAGYTKKVGNQTPNFALISEVTTARYKKPTWKGVEVDRMHSLYADVYNPDANDQLRFLFIYRVWI